MDSNIDLMTSVFELIPKTKHEDILKDLLQHVDVKSQNKEKETLLHILSRLGYVRWIEEILSFNNNLEVDIDIIGPDGNTPLMVAAENGQFGVLELLIEKKADVNKQNFAKCNALHLATMNSHIKCIKKLVSCKCNVNVQDLSKLTPLLIATFCGHEETFDFLLESKADVNLRDRWNHNALHYAVFNGNLNFVKKLVGADIELDVMANIEYNILQNLQRTPLMIAAERGFDHIIEFLLKHGTMNNIDNENYRKAILLSAFNGYIKCFKRLGGINTTIQLDDVSLTPLLLAAEGGRKNIIDYLLRLKSNIDFCGLRGNAVNYLLWGEYTARDGFIAKIIKSFVASGLEVDLKISAIGKETALIHATQWHIYDFRSCVSSGLEADLKISGFRKQTALLHAAQWYTSDVIKVLLSSGADINARDSGGRCALHYAVNNNLSVVKELVKNKININIQDDFGKTALMEALCSSSNTKRTKTVVNYLITSGANINLCSKGNRNALHYAVESGHLSVVKGLIRAKINMNTKDLYENGRTPLLKSIYNASIKIAHYLIYSGADVHISDYKGKDALYYTFEQNDLTLIKHLIKAKIKLKISYPLIFTSFEIIEFVLTSSKNNYENVCCDDLDAVYFAVSCGLMTITQKLIKTIDNINFEYFSQDKTLLMEAASRGHQNILELLLKSGANVNYLNEDGKNALHFVHNLACAKILINKGINVYLEDKFGYTPLMSAAKEGLTEVVDYLISYGNKNLEKNTYNAWKQAIANMHFKCADSLDRGFKKEEYELSFLEGLQNYDLFKYFKQFVHYYVKRKIDINIQDNKGMGLIHYAAEKYYFEGINEFVVNIISFDIANNNGETALILAAKHANPQNIEALISFGSNPNKLDKNGRNALHHLFLSLGSTYSAYEKFDKCLILLLNSGVNMNIVDEEQKTVLKILIEKRYKVRNFQKYINLLLESGADCNIRDDCGRTPLMLALINNCPDIVPLLLSSGAYVNIKDNIGHTPLMLAMENSNWLKLLKNQHRDLVNLLINSKADVNMTANNGQTALMMAVDSDFEDIVDILLKNGADVKICDKNGQDAFGLACLKRHIKCIKLLVQFMES